MADEDPLVNGQPLSSLRVVDLKEVLDKHGLSKNGNKKELADRLRDYLLNGNREEGSPTKSVASAEGLSSPAKSPENSLVAAYKARQAAALNKATEEKERVRRQSEHDSPEKEEVKEVKTPAKRGRKPKHVDAAEMEDEESPVKQDESKNEMEETPAKKAREESPIKKAEESPVKKEEKIEKSPVKKDEKKKSVEAVKEKEKAKSPVRSETLPVKSEEEEIRKKKEASSAANNNKVEKREKTPEKIKEVQKEEEKVNGDKMTAVAVAKRESDHDDHVELDYGEGEQEDNAEEETKSEVVKVEESIKEEKKVSPEKKTPHKSASRTRIEAPKSDKEERKSIEVSKDKEKEVKEKPRDVSPCRYPPSEILHIRGLMRPFTLPLLKNEICKTGGEIVDFWIDSLRSHCFVKLTSLEYAVAARETLHGTNWPTSNPKVLSVHFDNEENMERHKSGESPAPVSASLSRTISTDDKTDRSDRRERPTPLAGRNGLRVTLETMVSDNNKKEEKERERREREGREKAREIEKKMHERELKEKEERENRKRQRSDTPPHSRHDTKEHQRRKDSPERKERKQHDSDHARGEKQEEVAPIKTADEFFKKTIAQPSVYYLPLTEEQAAARAANKKEDHKR